MEKRQDFDLGDLLILADFTSLHSSEAYAFHYIQCTSTYNM